MKKILIINLRRLGDVYTTAHLINSLKNDGYQEISMLTYKESYKAAKNLANVNNVYCIDRQELITILSNQLFTDTYALDILANSLAEIKSNHWDKIVNYSNDTVAAYICSYLKESTQKIIGVHFNEFKNVETNNNWEVVFNDVLTTVKHSPIHFVDCYHKMLGVPYSKNGTKIILNAEHDEMAKANIDELRNQFNDPRSTKIVAIQMATSQSNKSLTVKQVYDYINLLHIDNKFVPLILIAPVDQERALANELNEKFNNSLTIVESDLSAIASVVSHVDLLVTPDTVVKHIADLTGTAVIEISQGESPFLKQGTYTTGNLVLTSTTSKRNYSESDAPTVSGQDIYSTTLFSFAPLKSIRPIISNGVTLYEAVRDLTGTNYKYLSGSIEPMAEINRLMSRQFLEMLGDQANIDSNIFDQVLTFGISNVTAWSNSEKEMITTAMRDLLGTLRALLQSVENKKNSKDFVVNLGKLIGHCDSTSATQLACIVFKTKLESLNAKTFEENAKQVENLLYDLKTNLQKNLHCLKVLDERIQTLKKEEFSGKNTLTAQA